MHEAGDNYLDLFRGPTPSDAAQTLYGTGRPARRCNACPSHGAQTEDQGWSGALWTEQANRRTGVRYHQVRAGLSPVLFAWSQESHRRMDAGLLGVELETHGRIASAVAKNRENRASSSKIQPKSSEFRPFQPNFTALAGSSPTGCQSAH